MKQTPEERFWAKVDLTLFCWEWTASKDTRGYGQLVVDGRMRKAYRYAYETLVGPVPAGLELDHLCRNRGCVNPAHLEPVTHRVNMLRGRTFAAANIAKTQCPQGHDYDFALPNGHRRCRRCTAEIARRVRAKKKAAQ